MSPTNVNGADDLPFDREAKTFPADHLQAEAERAELDARDLGTSEAFPIRAKKAPLEPSLEERAEHEFLYEPYRSWCRACWLDEAGLTDILVGQTQRKHFQWSV